MLLGKGAASAIEVSEHSSETSHLRVHVRRTSAWQLFGMSEALLSAIYDLKLPDAWWPASGFWASKLSIDTTWSPVPKLELFQKVMTNFLVCSKHGRWLLCFAVSQTRGSKA